MREVHLEYIKTNILKKSLAMVEGSFEDMKRT